MNVIKSYLICKTLKKSRTSFSWKEDKTLAKRLFMKRKIFKMRNLVLKKGISKKEPVIKK